MNGMSDHVNSTPESLDMGGAPPHTDTDWTSRLWAMSKNWQFKTTRCARALSLVTLFLFKRNSLSNVAGTPRTAGRSPRNQPSEEVQDRAKAVTSRSNEFNDCRAEERRAFPVTSRSSFKSPHESNRRSTNWPRDTRNKELSQHVELTGNETKASSLLQQRKQVSSLFLIELVNMIWMQ